MAEKQLAVRMRGITKDFAGKVLANDNVDLDVYHGEILALLGENGSGKTTLMNSLAGIYFPDSGTIEIDGEKVSIASPKDAFDHGIGMVHQHFKLVNVFTALENIVLGINDGGKYDLSAAAEKVRQICDTYGFDVNPKQKVCDMSVSQKQTVEIVKLLYRGVDTLILDEPTAVLTPQEADRLFDVMRNMRAEGKSVIIITHKLNEVLSISDRVAVLRKGTFAGEVLTAETNAQELTDMMVGHSVSLNIDRPESRPRHRMERIRVKNLTVRDHEGVTKLDDVSFSTYNGEILGIAGISGSGQKELLESIAGLQRPESGSVEYVVNTVGELEEVEQLVGMDPVKIAELGIVLSFVPEDRLGMGLVGNMDLADNMMLRSYRNGTSPFVDRKAPRQLAERVVDELAVKTPGIDTAVSSLSGGNVQKILVGREIASAPTVLLCAYVVRGLDVGSSHLIYDLLNRQKGNGASVVFVGEDLDVLLELCDRILVLCGGKVSGIVDARTATKAQLGLMMTKMEGGEA